MQKFLCQGIQTLHQKRRQLFMMRKMKTIGVELQVLREHVGSCISATKLNVNKLVVDLKSNIVNLEKDKTNLENEKTCMEEKIQNLQEE